MPASGRARRASGRAANCATETDGWATPPCTRRAVRRSRFRYNNPGGGKRDSANDSRGPADQPCVTVPATSNGAGGVAVGRRSMTSVGTRRMTRTGLAATRTSPSAVTVAVARSVPASRDKPPSAQIVNNTTASSNVLGSGGCEFMEQERPCRTCCQCSLCDGPNQAGSHGRVGSTTDRRTSHATASSCRAVAIYRRRCDSCWHFFSDCWRCRHRRR